MADDDIAQGLKTAVEAAADVDDGDDGPDPSPHHLPLFPSDRLDDLAADKEARRVQYEAARRGPGRPPGAKNKRTTEWLSYLEHRYPSPLVTLAEMRSRPTAQLAEELGCKPMEAAALQVRCADIEAPYWHGKKPVDVRIEGTRPMLAMVDPAAWLSRFEAEHSDAAAFDLTAVRVRGAELFDAQADALGQAVFRLAEGEHGENEAGTAEGDGARMAHAENKPLKNNDLAPIPTQRLDAPDDGDEP